MGSGTPPHPVLLARAQVLVEEETGVYKVETGSEPNEGPEEPQASLGEERRLGLPP